MSQRAVAEKSGVHAQSIGKIESGHTAVLKTKTRQGLAYALDIPEAHLDAVVKGITVEETGALKFCPQCWTPGHAPDAMWLPSSSAQTPANGSRRWGAAMTAPRLER